MNLDFEDNEKFLSLLHSAIAEEVRGYDDKSPNMGNKCLIAVYSLGILLFSTLFFITLIEFIDNVTHMAIAISFSTWLLVVFVSLVITAWRDD